MRVQGGTARRRSARRRGTAAASVPLWRNGLGSSGGGVAMISSRLASRNRYAIHALRTGACASAAVKVWLVSVPLGGDHHREKATATLIACHSHEPSRTDRVSPRRNATRAGRRWVWGNFPEYEWLLTNYGITEEGAQGISFSSTTWTTCRSRTGRMRRSCNSSKTMPLSFRLCECC